MISIFGITSCMQKRKLFILAQCSLLIVQTIFNKLNVCCSIYFILLQHFNLFYMCRWLYNYWLFPKSTCWWFAFACVTGKYIVYTWLWPVCKCCIFQLCVLKRKVSIARMLYGQNELDSCKYMKISWMTASWMYCKTLILAIVELFETMLTQLLQIFKQCSLYFSLKLLNYHVLIHHNVSLVPVMGNTDW